MSASQVIPGIWIGSAPPVNQDWSDAPANHIVLAAKELEKEQTPDKYPGATLLYAELDDDYETSISPSVWAEVLKAAEKAASWYLKGIPVVFTCHEGHNRSSFIAGVTMVLSKAASPEEAVHLIRAARGHAALQNPQFMKALLSMKTRDQEPLAS